MTGSQDTFWWLIALVAAAVVMFAGLLWLRLRRQAEREGRARQVRREED
ncbi:hypothetical protein LRS10_03215 [Phenylobacterium sp. J426]|nr:hypothetical protein [Phenylobacterium sp. J426]MCR5873287.1 hypothetical protein [Phenylobacterium sp. J426]